MKVFMIIIKMRYSKEQRTLMVTKWHKTLVNRAWSDKFQTQIGLDYKIILKMI